MAAGGYYSYGLIVAMVARPAVAAAAEKFGDNGGKRRK